MDCEPEPILEKEWDILIILDACRYDAFESTYEKYLDGQLDKIRGACSTLTWLNGLFNEENYDICYVSANPYINSMGVRRDSFNAGEKFEKIYDVWDYGWSDDLETVPPSQVTKTAVEVSDEHFGRMIVHYMQPHKPYRLLTVGSSFNFINPLVRLVKRHHILKKISINLCQVLGWRPPGNPDPNKFKSRYSKQEMLNYHIDNLEWVLPEVNKLVNSLEGDIVVTSDHGDAFGENGEWFHHPPTENPVIRNVPWLVVD